MTTAQPGQEQRMELKACPFCGGPGHLDRFVDPPRGRGWHVVCHGAKYCPVYCSTPYSDLLNKAEAVAHWNTRPTADLGEDGELIERLRVHARCASDVHRLMAEAKTARQTDGGHYGWISPEQTDEWQAADRLILYREALERIAEWPWPLPRSVEDGVNQRESVRDIARALLSRSGDD